MAEPTIEMAPDRSAWSVFGASTRGASHVASDLPNQDAWGSASLETSVVAAVADGHGHFRHFRSGRGSELAVAQAIAVARDAHGRLETIGSAAELETLAREELVPPLLEGWRAAVAQDHRVHPFSPEEAELAERYGDEPVIAYGSTLLCALVGERWAVISQIGDGDVLALMSDGRATAPMPVDPELDGRFTTSLCQPSALGSFRVALIDQETTPLTGIVLATDGFANAQRADPWTESVGEDLFAMLGDHGPDWLAERLPEWTARCASSDGSGDDTTLVVVVRRP